MEDWGVNGSNEGRAGAASAALSQRRRVWWRKIQSGRGVEGGGVSS